MPKYSIIIRKSARKQLDKLPDAEADKLLNAIEALGNDPRPIGCKKLKGREGYRIREGNYRIIYDIIDGILTVDVIAAGHRKDIYE